MAKRPHDERKPPRKNGKNAEKSGVSRSKETFQSGASRAIGQSSARATASGPAHKTAPTGLVDQQTQKMLGAEAVAHAMPFNKAKASEFGAAPPATGQSIDPPQPMVSGST